MQANGVPISPLIFRRVLGGNRLKKTLKKCERILEKCWFLPLAENRRETCLGSNIFYSIYTEQMDAEGLGRKLLLTVIELLTLSGSPRRAPEKETVGTVRASHKMLTLQALSGSLNVGTAKRGLPGPRRGFWVPSGSLSPKTAASICTLEIFVCNRLKLNRNLFLSPAPAHLGVC